MKPALPDGPPVAAAQERPMVTPRRGGRAPQLPPLAVLVANGQDLAALGMALGLERGAGRDLFTSRLLLPAAGGPACSLAGPLIGAPYAVMLLETLAAWGAREILFLGWCGALSPALAVGDLLMPPVALIDEGTSRHYRPGARTARSSVSGAARLERALTSCGATCHRGPVWTTDGVFRETAGKVSRFREKGALAVEMELSALFSAGAHLGVSAAGLLVVSDLLWGDEWRPGFRDPRFQEGRRRAVQVIQHLCQTI